jgi:anti-sigma factor RsiW
MITCEVFRRHADALVDGEVDLTAQVELEEHSSRCSACRDHLAFAASFQRLLRESAQEAPSAPADLASRVRRALDVEDARRAAERGQLFQPSSSGPSAGHAAMGASDQAGPPLGLTGVRVLPFRAKYAVPAAAAVAALAILAAREGGNPVEAGGVATSAGAGITPGATYLDDVVERHWRGHPVEVSGPPPQVERWFDDKVGFRVRSIDFASSDARLIGARLSNVREREAAQLEYDVHGHRVTVFVFERPPAPMERVVQRRNVQGRGIYYGYARGRAVPVVEHGGLTYALVGDLDERSLMRLAASARVADR